MVSFALVENVKVYVVSTGFLFFVGEVERGFSGFFST